MSIAGIDIGTTGCKCSLYSEDGGLITEAYREYRRTAQTPANEISPRAVWLHVREVLQAVSPKAGELRAVGVTSFGESVVLADGEGEPLCGSMLYTDPRGEEQCRQMEERFGGEALFARTGLRPHSMYSLPKLMWLGQNQPELLERAARLFLFQDFVVFRLSGAAQIDYSLASRSMAFDVVKLAWDRELLSWAGINPDKLSKPVPVGSAAGPIRPDLARELGLPGDAVVVSGCHDQVAATVGCGVLEPGMAVDGAGTVECVTPVFAGVPDRAVLYRDSFSLTPHATAGRYASYAFSFTGGALLKWYRDELDTAAGEKSYRDYDRRINLDRPTGLLVLPHFEGAATPYMDSRSRGAVVGLTTSTRSIDIYQALMEGVVYEMLVNIRELEQAGAPIQSLRASGGGASSPEWLQMKADILERPVQTMGSAQAGTLGCVMLAGAACGVYRDLTQAAEVFVRPGRVYEPREEVSRRYRSHFQRYGGLYGAVKSVL